MDTVTFM